MAKKSKKTAKSSAKKPAAVSGNAAAAQPEPKVVETSVADSDQAPTEPIGPTSPAASEPAAPAASSELNVVSGELSEAATAAGDASEPLTADVEQETAAPNQESGEHSEKEESTDLVGKPHDSAKESHDLAEKSNGTTEKSNDAAEIPNGAVEKSGEFELSGSHRVDPSAALAALQEKLEQAELERDDIQEEYDGLLERVTLIKQKLEQRFKELESDVEQAKAETAKAEAKSAELRAETDKAKAEKAEVSRKLAESEQLVAQSRRDAELAREAESTANQQARAAESRAEQSAREISDLRAKLLKEKAITGEQSQTILAEQQKFATLKLEADQLKSQLVRQKIMFEQDVLNERLAKENLEAEVTQLSSSLQDTETIALQAAQTTSAQEREISRLQTELKLLQTHSESTKQTDSDRQTQLERERDQATAELNTLRPQLAELAKSLSSAQSAQAQSQSEAKENQLLIGKLRHEAVILNEHLTQSLRMIRKDSEGSTVDKELISNLFVQYATCAAKDTKKFEILQLIANFLDWDDVRRQSAGLMRSEDNMELGDLPPTQMVGFVGRLAEYLENRRHRH